MRIKFSLDDCVQNMTLTQGKKRVYKLPFLFKASDEALEFDSVRLTWSDFSRSLIRVETGLYHKGTEQEFLLYENIVDFDDYSLTSTHGNMLIIFIK